MANKQLVDYIKAQLNAGYDISSIEKVLEQNKYKSEDIDSAVNAALMGETPKGSHVKTGVLIGAGLVLLVLIGLFIFWPKSSTGTNTDSLVETPNDNTNSHENMFPSGDENVEPEPKQVNNTEVNPSEKAIVPDRLIGPPEAEPTFDDPVLLPSSAIEVAKNSSVAVTMKVYQTNYISNLIPTIDCDLISSDSIIIYPFEGIETENETAEITFVLKPQNVQVFAQCSAVFATNDAHVVEKQFVITILP